ncbi:adenylate kinase [Halobellus salinus]|uniref:Putative adenylate kinase n=1 Tax=Halobellus salinus TaxID=931585 RepID=A0A830EG59_9EURY|nr:adenylate kinase family protein [Halobellus salinus]GGJ08717.1 adenylate kinase [Halobellus salinus]SMP28442.1 adenylate kinase [Halobellus salinus]
MTTVALAGTPGTGKTTVSDLAAGRLGVEVVHLNDAIRDAGLFSERDIERDSLVADLGAVEAWLNDYRASDTQSGHNGDDHGGGGVNLLVESHLAHLLDADRVVVLRCHPESLKPRLRDRGESEASVAENAESEALDQILAAAVDRHGRESVWEIDTTDRAPEAVADDVAAAIRGETDPRVGVVDFIEYL